MTEVFWDLFIARGLPKCIGSDNGPEITSKSIQKWLDSLKVGSVLIELGGFGTVVIINR